jgi:hypothetical protein
VAAQLAASQEGLSSVSKYVGSESPVFSVTAMMVSRKKISA